MYFFFKVQDAKRFRNFRPYKCTRVVSYINFKRMDFISVLLKKFKCEILQEYVRFIQFHILKISSSIYVFKNAKSILRMSFILFFFRNLEKYFAIIQTIVHKCLILIFIIRDLILCIIHITLNQLILIPKAFF